MNKAKKALLVSTIVAGSIFAKVSDAVASTLQANDKQDFQTEQITEITDHTASSISMNLDNTPPDSTEIKNFFIKGDILDTKELKDFNQIWNNAAKSGIRDFYQQQIEKLFNGRYTDDQKKIFTIAILDPNQTTAFGQNIFEQLNQNRAYQFRFSQMLRSMELEINISELDKRNAELDKRNAELDKRNAELDKEIKEIRAEGKELEQRGKELEQRGKELEALLKSLKKMEEAFKQYQQDNK